MPNETKTAKPATRKAKANPRSSKASSRLEDARERMYHDLIFESAESVFGQKGYDGTTMQDIAHEAGISLKTLYGAFAGKQELYEEIQRVRAVAFVDAIGEAMGHEGAPFERVAFGIRAYVEFLYANPSWLNIHMRARAIYQLNTGGLAAAPYWKDGLGHYRAVIDEGIANGDFYGDDTEELAIVTQSLMQAVVARAFHSGEKDIDAVVDRIVELIGRLLCVSAAQASSASSRPQAS